MRRPGLNIAVRRRELCKRENLAQGLLWHLSRKEPANGPPKADRLVEIHRWPLRDAHRSLSINAIPRVA